MTRTVFITGASSGFGAACARKFAADGNRLILLARRQQRLQALADELKHCDTHLISIDITDQQALEMAIQRLPEAFNSPDILINNAGLALGLSGADQAELSHWQQMIDTNITALVHLTRLILPGMVSRDRGHIINIGSTAGNWPYPGGNVYGATKAFVKQFSRGLRADLLGKRIKVTNIEPGLAETEFSLVRFGHDAGRAAEVYDGTKPISAEDLADIIHWVCNTPAHININALEIMPLCQSWGPFRIDRQMTFD